MEMQLTGGEKRTSKCTKLQRYEDLKVQQTDPIFNVFQILDLSLQYYYSNVWFCCI